MRWQSPISCFSIRLSGTAPIGYEPEVVLNGTRFDFVATGADGEAVYVEVKTVEPRTDDTSSNWQKVKQRQKRLTDDTHYVDKDWLGATIFCNSFSARSSFMAYTLETEGKLRAHVAIRSGRGVLVFCGTVRLAFIET